MATGNTFLWISVNISGMNTANYSVSLNGAVAQGKVNLVEAEIEAYKNLCKMVEKRLFGLVEESIENYKGSGKK